MKLNSELCLVTGACGFVGSHLIEALVSNGFKVRATDLAPSLCRYLPSDRSANIEFVPADITDTSQIRSLVQGVKIVFHTAGIFRFDVSPRILDRVNVEGTENLFSALLGEDISHVVNWSSAMIYGKLQYTPAKETHPICPEDPYSESKWAQEQVGMKYYNENGINITSIRPTAIYGPRSFYGTGRLLVALANRKVLGIPGSGKTIQHHVFVEDVVRAAIFIAKEAKTTGQSYNVADEHPISIEESFDIVKSLYGYDVPKIHFPRLVVLAYGFLDRFLNRLLNKSSLYEKTALSLLFSDHIYDNTKLKRLGFQYLTPGFENGIIPTVGWYLNEGLIPPVLHN
ncbi:MAG: NAD-dependent epimerase/dehydratase family protein [Candidatus Heimdallarchaeota archaeon]